MIKIAVAGKTNVGKSSLFSAATHIDVEISNRIFTTIRPNMGMGFVRRECICQELGLKCNPRNSKCVNGNRLIPVELVDIAGLVPDAHLGKGLGNQFLSDIMNASCLIHVVDISGSTDINGNPAPKGSHNPEEDIEFFEKEIDYWLLGIIRRALDTVSKRVDIDKIFSDIVAKQFSGLGISQEDIKNTVEHVGLNISSSEEDLLEFIKALRKKCKPIIIAANKMDIPEAENMLKKLKTDAITIPCSAEAELALRKAAEKGIIEYIAGDCDFKIIGEIDEKHMKALEFIRSLMKKFGSTGVQEVINRAALDLLNMITVYPVENETRFSDSKGNVLPDVFLMNKGSTALDLAYRIHEDIGKRFISAVDARTKRHLSAQYILKDNDIISIKSGR